MEGLLYYYFLYFVYILIYIPWDSHVYFIFSVVFLERYVPSETLKSLVISYFNYYYYTYFSRSYYLYIYNYYPYSYFIYNILLLSIIISYYFLFYYCIYSTSWYYIYTCIYVILSILSVFIMCYSFPFCFSNLTME